MRIRSLLICCACITQSFLLAQTSKPNNVPLDFQYDFLYWKAKQKGLAFTNSPSNVFVTTDFTKPSLKFPHFEWDPGFKLGINYRFTPWQVNLNWIYFRSKARGSETTRWFEGEFPVWSISSNILPLDYATSARMNWKITFNQLDLDFQRSLPLYNFFTLIFHMGLSNLWIAQDGRVKYTGGSFMAGKDINSMDSHFYGVGPKIGVEPVFFLGKGFSLRTFIKGAAYYSLFHITQKEIFAFRTLEEIDRRFQKFRWNAGATVALRWEHTFLKKYMKLAVDFGWDYLFFYKQNMFERAPVSLPSQSRNLIISGFHLGITFGF